MTKPKASSDSQCRFVLATGDGIADSPGTRKMIRKNAMKAFRRSERLNRMKEYAHSIAEDKGLQKVECDLEDGRTHLDTPNQDCLPPDIDFLGVRSQAQNTVADPSLGLLFSPLHLLPSDGARRLLHHFINYIIPQLQPLGTIQDRSPIAKFFVPRALHSPGVLASVLFHSGVHLDTLQNRMSWTPITLYYRGETIRTIQEDLLCEKAFVHGLAMVAFLAATGNITGDITPEQSHIYALQRLVDMQGGLGAIGRTQGSLALLLATGDLISSTISGNLPALDRLDISENVHLGFLPADTASIVMASSGHSDTENTLVSLKNIISNLATLQNRLAEDTETTVTSVLAFGHLCCAVEHRLLCLGTYPTPCNANDVLSQATRDALVLCMSMIFRGLRSLSPIFIVSQGRLMASLAALDMSSLDYVEENHQILLWILCVGGVSCVPRRQPWYAEKIAQVLRMVHGQSEKATIEWLRTGLVEFVWDAKLDGMRFGVLWDEVCMVRSRW